MKKFAEFIGNYNVYEDENYKDMLRYKWFTADNKKHYCIDLETGEIVAGGKNFDISSNEHKEFADKMRNVTTKLKGDVVDYLDTKRNAFKCIHSDIINDESFKNLLTAYCMHYAYGEEPSKAIDNLLKNIDTLGIKLEKSHFNVNNKGDFLKLLSNIDKAANSVNAMKEKAKELGIEDEDIVVSLSNSGKIVINITKEYGGNRTKRKEDFSKIINDLELDASIDKKGTEATIKNTSSKLALHIRDKSSSPSYTNVFASDFYSSVDRKNKISVEGKPYIAFTKDNVHEFRETMKKSFTNSEKITKTFTANEIKLVNDIFDSTKMVNGKEVPDVKKMVDLCKKCFSGDNSLDSDKMFSSFGEVLAPYLMLSCNDDNDIKAIKELGFDGIDLTTNTVMFPDSQNEKSVDFIMVSMNNEDSKTFGLVVNETGTKEEIEKNRKDAEKRLAEAIKNEKNKISSKNGDGHACDISTKINDFLKGNPITKVDGKYVNLDTVEPNLRKILEKANSSPNKLSPFEHFIESYCNSSGKGSDKAYKRYIDSTITSFYNSTKDINIEQFNQLKSCTKKEDYEEFFKNNKNLKEKLKNYMAKQLNLSDKPKKNKDVFDDLFENNFPGCLSMYSAKIVSEELQNNKEYHDVIKSLITQHKYMQLRLRKSSNGIKFFPTFVDDNIMLKFKVNSSSSDFYLGKMGAGFVIADN